MTKALHFLTRGRVAAGILAAVLLTGSAQAASWTASGNEPSWRVEISDTAITFSTLDGENFAIEPVPAPVRAEGVEVYSGKTGDDTVTLVATDKICSDAMSGMPHPKTVVVAVGDRAFVGCGGDPLSLLVGDWRIEEIAGEPVIAGSETSLAFDLDGSMHGNGSCNRFFGGFTLTGEGLTLSPGGSTMMACEQALMDQEQKFLATFETVSRFESLADGRLRLLDVDGNAALVARK